MTKRELPDGVPADNAGDTGERGFRAPEMATPKFAPAERDLRITNPRRDHGAAINADGFEEDQMMEERAGKPFLPLRDLKIFIGLAVVLAALGALVVLSNRDPLPLCSDQPHWNQYNCRVN